MATLEIIKKKTTTPIALDETFRSNEVNQLVWTRNIGEEHYLHAYANINEQQLERLQLIKNIGNTLE